MTKVEIWDTLEAIRDTLVQVHVQLNDALDQLTSLESRIQDDIKEEG